MASNYITNKHRKFYVNGKLEFALFYDPNVVDTEKIINDFLNSKDWKWHVEYFKVKVISTSISHDLLEVQITVGDK